MITSTVFVQLHANQRNDTEILISHFYAATVAIEMLSVRTASER